MASASIAITPCHHGLTYKASDSMAVAADFYKKVVNAGVGIVSLLWQMSFPAVAKT